MGQAGHRALPQALGQQRELLSELEAKNVLSAYGIPVVRTRIAESAEHAAEVAATVGYPLALTVLSPDIARKWDVGGVALNLESADAVRTAAAGMVKRVGERMPQARITDAAPPHPRCRSAQRSVATRATCNAK